MQLFPLLSPSAPGNHCYTFCLYELDGFKFLTEVHPAGFVFFRLAYLTQGNVLDVHPRGSVGQGLLPSEADKCPCLCVYCISRARSLLGGYLRCFHVLPIVDSDAVHTGV